MCRKGVISETPAYRKCRKKIPRQDPGTGHERIGNRGRSLGSGVTHTSRGMPRAGWSPQFLGEQGNGRRGRVHIK